MTTNNEEKNVYVQPDCKVFQVQIQQMIATSQTNTTVNNAFGDNTEEEW